MDNKIQEVKNNIITKYNLKEICRFFKMLGETNNFKNIYLDNISFLDKKYIIKKENDNLIVECLDGRTLNLKIDFKTLKYQDSDYYFKPCQKEIGTASFEYFFPNGDKLNFKNTMHLIKSNDYELFKSLNENQFAFMPEISYFSNKDNLLINGSNDFNYISMNLENKNISFRFTDDGIIYNNYNLVSLDGTRLLKVNDKDIMPYKALKEFNTNEVEQDLSNMIAREQKLSPNVLNMMHEVVSNLDAMESNVNSYLNFYNNDIPICQKIVGIKNELINNINNYTFAKEELLFLLKTFVVEIKEEYSKEKSNNNSKKYIKN